MFSIGDRVMVIGEGTCIVKHAGRLISEVILKTGNTTLVNNEFITLHPEEYRLNPMDHIRNSYMYSYEKSDYELALEYNKVSQEINPMLYTSNPEYNLGLPEPPKNHLFNKFNNKIMELKKFIKNLRLTEEEKLLRENGLKNDCGEYTEEYKEIVLDKIFKENEEYVVNLVTEKLKSEKKDK